MSKKIPFSKRGRSIVNSNMNPLNVIDDFFGDAMDSVSNLNKNIFSDSFRVDVSETDSHYVVEAELPAVKKQEIELNLSEGRLSITVERNEEMEQTNDNKTYLHKERRYTSMQRSVFLVDAVAESGLVEAKLDNGLLEVTVPKVEMAITPDLSPNIEIQ